MSKKGKKIYSLPKFYKNIGSKYLGFYLPLPIFLLHIIGIGRGIGWGIYNKNGNLPLFNEDLFIATDYEFLLRCKLNEYSMKYVPCTYYHQKNGRSSKDWNIGVQEERKIAQKYCKEFNFKNFNQFNIFAQIFYKRIFII